MPKIKVILIMISTEKSFWSFPSPIRARKGSNGSIDKILLMGLLYLFLAQPCLAATEKPPDAVITGVRQAVSQREHIPVNRLQLKSAEARTWSDGCLGLAKSGELCTQSLIEGWRIILTDDKKTWIYRTDGTGRAIRLESPN